ncbi:hypothetical protein OROMI_004428 [Orobanche minor]
MPLSYFRVFFIISLILLPLAARGDNDGPPSLAPFFDDLCKEVECGRGSCERAIGSPFNFKCKCNNGWKRTRIDDEQDLEFLPCIIPDCEVDYSCMPAAPPLPSTPHNISFFDRLLLGLLWRRHVRKKHNTHPHVSMQFWLLTRDCAIGSNSCERLVLESSTSTSNPSSNNGDSNQAIAFILGKFNWITVLFATAAVAFWK